MKILQLSDNEIAQLYCAGFSCSKIAKLCVCDKATISSRLSKLNVPKRTPEEVNHLKRKCLPFSDDEIKQMYLDGLDITNISKKANCDFKLIDRILQKLNVTKRTMSETYRKYPLNESFFDVINTEEKAYFLGLLYADGSNYTIKNRVSLKLQEQDKYIIDKLATLIFDVPRKLSYEKSVLLYNRYKCSPTYKLVITNKHMSQQLVKLGCVSKKSLVLTFPTEKQVPAHLLNHFIRGYFDGDGCIHISKTYSGVCSFGLCGTKEFLIKTREFLVLNCNLNRTKIIKQRNIYVLSYGGCQQNKRIKEYLYKNATVYLHRKHLKFLQLYP